ncbi:hypothetical protein AAFF_G00380960 [Aldrovandia affinis]|uniref:Integrase catalytic domain-containing protein n=1 Tax=Aldrovandia affinis TaxID=143900 RepID=A0AAD7T7V9_9TELE|nr:hypothetical protein AAFF_G00380960 [Aldrovandia affinis]
MCHHHIAIPAFLIVVHCRLLQAFPRAPCSQLLQALRMSSLAYTLVSLFSLSECYSGDEDKTLVEWAFCGCRRSLPECIYQEKLKECFLQLAAVHLSSYTGDIIPVLWQTQVPVKYEGKEWVLPLIVVEVHLAWATAPWERILAHPKWMEVSPTKLMAAEKSINLLRHLFSAYGLLKELVSDNGPPFIAAQF